MLKEHLPDVNVSEGLATFTADRPAAEHVFSIGKLPTLKRFLVCYRRSAWWMEAAFGTETSQVPPETQFLLIETTQDDYLLIIPLIHEPFRMSLYGSETEGLQLKAQTGNPNVTGQALVGLFAAVGNNPYTLVAESARYVMSHLGTGRLRAEKSVPAFVDTFGWCTWDAFYQGVSHESVMAGLQSFADVGCQPRYLIVDDGWQDIDDQGRLHSFAANAKFPGGLRRTIQRAKADYGLAHFLVWHAVNGYWNGCGVTGYATREVNEMYQPESFGTKRQTTTLQPQDVYRFYNDFHAALRQEGVDGVKIDNQASIESLAQADQNRVGLMRSFHTALEGTANTHFRGDLINCMSCSNDMLYSALNSTVTRTSDDFFPAQPETHGRHLHTNAYIGLWFGEFVLPDWDMFQSGHAMGALHAMARAVSGGPVYVSDKPAEHDAELLTKLVLPDGRILRAALPGRPTRDCLFTDPLTESVLLKVFNHNAGSGVIGAFNIRADGDIAGRISPRDVVGLVGQRFAVYRHSTAELRILTSDEDWPLELPPLCGDLFTISPVEQGVAPLGLVNMFNSGGSIQSRDWLMEGLYHVRLVGAGHFLIYSEPQPQALIFNGQEIDYTYQANRLQFELPHDGTIIVKV